MRRNTSKKIARKESWTKSPKPFRKAQKVKNRKSIRFKKFVFIGLGSLVLFSFLFTSFFIIIFLTQPPLLSPLPKVMNVTKAVDDSMETELARVLKGSTIAVKDIKAYSDNTYVVETQDGAKIIFGTDKDLYSQISSLQLIVSRLTMEGKRFTHLDLRYDKPVVTFN